MIRNIKIANFKSIASQSIPLGRFTVLIGENGAGKSNILEALVMASAASTGRLEREILIGRGMRVTSPTLMRSAFDVEENKKDVELSVSYGIGYSNTQEFYFSLTHDEGVYSDWILLNKKNKHENKIRIVFLPEIHLMKFTTYSPDYLTLRNFITDSQTLPLGTRGEGLAELLINMRESEPNKLDVINEGLALLGFCEKVYFDSLSSKKIYVKDRYIQRDGALLDQMSTNEGFLFCLFYLVLFSSSSTPAAFAIENIENGLNPKLVEALVKKLKELGAKYGKQAIISTHSPAILDALNLDDEENDVLLAVSRNLDGHTRVNRVKKPRNSTGKITRLSELFLRGLLGGVPKNFV